MGPLTGPGPSTDVLSRTPFGGPVLGFLVAGLVIGAFARLITPGRQHLSVPMTLLLGLAGSSIAGLVADLPGTGGLFELDVLGFVVAVIAAVLLIGVAEGAQRALPHPGLSPRAGSAAPCALFHAGQSARGGQGRDNTRGDP